MWESLVLASKNYLGYTLAELMVIITVTSILSLAFMGIFTNYLLIITRNNASIDLAVNSQNLLRTTVEAIRLGEGVRQTNSLADLNAPPGGWNTSNTNFVIVISTPALDVYHNYIIDSSTGSPYMNELVYYKNSNSLMQRVLANPGATGNSTKTTCPPSVATASCPADKDLADHVNTMVFTLYDQNGAAITDPVLARSIKIDLGMRQNSVGTILTLDNSIRVTLRNRF